MANRIDLVSKCKHSGYYTFEVHSLVLLELMDGIFGPVPNNPIHIEHSIGNGNWLRFTFFSDVNFTVNSARVRLLCPVLM